MKVALFSSSFYPNVGGVEEAVRQLAREQQRRGGDPLVITNRWPKKLAVSDSIDGVPVLRYVFRVPEPNWRQMGGAILLGPSTLRRITGAIQRHGADVLHVHCISSNAYYAMRAKVRLGLPLVVTLHAELTMDAGRLFQRSRFARELFRSALAQADAVTACSARTLADAEAFVGQELGLRGRVIFNGVNCAESDAVAPYSHERPYLLAMGRLVPQKGFDVLLRAFAAANVDACDLIIAGDGAERSALESLAIELGLAERVFFFGAAERKAALALLKGCLYFVLPSTGEEGLPMTCLEAMAAGKAVVASRSGGVPEIVVHERSGLLVEKGDVTGLRGALERLCADNAIRTCFEQSARASALGLSWGSIADQYQDVYDAVCKKTERLRVS